MRIPTRTIGLGLVGLTGVSSALPITNTTTPFTLEAINSTDAVFANDTQLVAKNTQLYANETQLYANETQLYANETQLHANETQLVANDTPLMSWVTAPRQDHHSLFKRDLPPRDRKLADHMEHYGEGLPECYKKCMRSEDGKSSIHMGQDTLGQICGVKWPLFAWWTEHHLVYCVNGENGCKGDQPHQDAFNWLKSTCGDKPN